jgi:hypothetical protein
VDWLTSSKRRMQKKSNKALQATREDAYSLSRTRWLADITNPACLSSGNYLLLITQKQTVHNLEKPRRIETKDLTSLEFCVSSAALVLPDVHHGQEEAPNEFLVVS